MLNMKLKRIELGMNQNDLATKIGITAAMVSMYESDKTTPSLETIKKIADALNTTIDFLVER